VCNQRDGFLFPRCEKRFPKQPITPLLDAYVHACFTIADVPMHAWCPCRKTRKACVSIRCCTLDHSVKRTYLLLLRWRRSGNPSMCVIWHRIGQWAFFLFQDHLSVHAHAGDQIMLSTLGVESHGQACYDSQSGIILPGTYCFYQR
jgi:hypothetical protein